MCVWPVCICVCVCMNDGCVSQPGLCVCTGACNERHHQPNSPPPFPQPHCILYMTTPSAAPPPLLHLTHTHTRTDDSYIQYFLLIAVTFGSDHFLRGSDSVSPLTPSEWVWTHTRSLFFCVLIWIIAGGCSQKCITMINWTLRTYQAIQGQCAVKQEGTGTDVGQSGDVAACDCCSKRNVSRNLGLISAFEIWDTFRFWKCFCEARRAPPSRSSCRFMQCSQWLT